MGQPYADGIDADEIDIAHVRSQFPAFERRTPNGEPVVYFDGPGGTQVPRSVIEAMSGYLAARNANTDGAFPSSAETDDLIATARQAAGAFVNGDPSGVAFGHNMTTLNFSLSRALGRTLRPGDEIVTTRLDHDANISPWLLLAADRDLIVREVGLTDELELDERQLRESLSDRTRVVAFTLASNAVGTLTQAAQIALAAHEVGALAWVDAVAYSAHRRTDVAAIGCDVLLCSPYKFFGPHHGLAWLNPGLAASLPADRVRPAAQLPVGHRFETGTLSHEALAGFVAAVEYIESLGRGPDRRGRLDDAFRRISVREGLLAERFVAGLKDVPGVRIAGIDDADGQRRVGVFGLITDHQTPSSVAAALASAGVYAWSGNFYAREVISHLGLDQDEGLLRIGLYHYNTEDEIDRCLAVLKDSSTT